MIMILFPFSSPAECPPSVALDLNELLFAHILKCLHKHTKLAYLVAFQGAMLSMVERPGPGFRLFLWVSMTAIQPMLENPPTWFFSESSPLGAAGGCQKLGLAGCNLFPEARLKLPVRQTECMHRQRHRQCQRYGHCQRRRPLCQRHCLWQPHGHCQQHQGFSLLTSTLSTTSARHCQRQSQRLETCGNYTVPQYERVPAGAARKTSSRTSCAPLPQRPLAVQHPGQLEHQPPA